MKAQVVESGAGRGFASGHPARGTANPATGFSGKSTLRDQMANPSGGTRLRNPTLIQLSQELRE